MINKNLKIPIKRIQKTHKSQEYLLYIFIRHLDYEIHVLAQANVAMMFRSPLKADTFGIFQSR